ncbi:hypothetical protein AB0D90_32715 [Streptomyces althioticus]|uniref:hypothetical protein n=1 Tax=Streptomyces althioticus TaxID=83380 RepID=UPI0034017A24
MSKKQSTAAKRAREAVRQGDKYTRVLRSTSGDHAVAGAATDATEPDDGFGGHEFEYESSTDLFRCTECRESSWPTRSGQRDWASA